MTFGAYLDDWLDGLRLAPSTIASYRKNVRVHVVPALGRVPLGQLTPVRLDALYRQLQAGGRADYREGEGLSARTTRYIHTIISGALRDAADVGLIARNPAQRAHPPTAKQARSPEMHPWSAPELAAFLTWSASHCDPELHAAWTVLAHTGIRRGEALALRWRDVDFGVGTITVRRSAGLIRVKGRPTRLEDGPTKTGRPRVVDVDAATISLLRKHRAERGELNLALAGADGLVFGNLEGRHRHPEHFSRRLVPDGGACHPQRYRCSADPAA